MRCILSILSLHPSHFTHKHTDQHCPFNRLSAGCVLERFWPWRTECIYCGNHINIAMISIVTLRDIFKCLFNWIISILMVTHKWKFLQIQSWSEPFMCIQDALSSCSNGTYTSATETAFQHLFGQKMAIQIIRLHLMIFKRFTGGHFQCECWPISTVFAQYVCVVGSVLCFWCCCCCWNVAI